jgi:endonuclease YncB( thermonuclease family)
MKLNFTSTSSKLKKASNSTPFFSLKNKFKLCKVVDVYDGDSCKVVFSLRGEVNKWTIRLKGYDTPELRPSKLKENREEEIACAKKARDYLSKLVMNEGQLVYIKCGDFDKYGRLLGTLFLKEKDVLSVNQMMIDNGHGYKYDGGKKKIFGENKNVKII